MHNICLPLTTFNDRHCGPYVALCKGELQAQTDAAVQFYFQQEYEDPQLLSIAATARRFELEHLINTAAAASKSAAAAAAGSAHAAAQLTTSRKSSSGTSVGARRLNTALEKAALAEMREVAQCGLATHYEQALTALVQAPDSTTLRDLWMALRVNARNACVDKDIYQFVTYASFHRYVFG